MTRWGGIKSVRRGAKRKRCEYGGVDPDFDDLSSDFDNLKHQIETSGCVAVDAELAELPAAVAVRTPFYDTPAALRAEEAARRHAEWKKTSRREFPSRQEFQRRHRRRSRAWKPSDSAIYTVEARPSRERGWKTPEIKSYIVEDRPPEMGERFILQNPEDRARNGHIFRCTDRANVRISAPDSTWPGVELIGTRIADAVVFEIGNLQLGEDPALCRALRVE